eukprot:Plantae.Rhodophyta-Purpureofilum_apyrenoidigerum.ctg44962.p1 GENE.Plantae.Rhodophyta-Purpureofilum_apyrenoidigerum.ctg44962~~Plantae.Rhodophyta-Purpureofilum_apyrenoidigerum.ctg44962.p1  ORF type:complete len:386 (+),score=36.53 Plantae.Rhodophyta-Purpureofilum_apyrenoidigerum.ctg44962:130-1158(+)
MGSFIAPSPRLLRSGVDRTAARMSMGQRVLQTNDDGYSSPGLLLLREALRSSGIARPIVIAPAINQSACGQRLTLADKLTLMRHSSIGEDVFSISGTPADCALHALDPGGFAHDPPPSLVVSGINLGANMSHDVLYSGTFAGARQAAMLGYPAISTSLCGEDFSNGALNCAVKATLEIVAKLLNVVNTTPPNPNREVLVRQAHNKVQHPDECGDVHTALLDAFRHGDILLNINTPSPWTGRFCSTSLAAIAYRDVVKHKNDQVWLGDVTIEEMQENPATCDVNVTKEGNCSVTVLQTWPESHPLRVSDTLMQIARKPGWSGLPAWLERTVSPVGVSQHTMAE